MGEDEGDVNGRFRWTCRGRVGSWRWEGGNLHCGERCATWMTCGLEDAGRRSGCGRVGDELTGGDGMATTLHCGAVCAHVSATEAAR